MNLTELSKEEQLTILTAVAEDKGIVENAVEKDYWVSMVLRAIFSLPYLPHTISFLPPESIEDILRDDYKQMQIGFIYADAPTFDEILERLSELQNRFRTLIWKNNR